MTQNKEEQELELYLKGELDLSAIFRSGSKEEPALHVDDAIRAASRRELGTGPDYACSPFASKWQVPLSLAAVLVLSVSVFLTMQQDYHESNFNSPAEDQTVQVKAFSEMEKIEQKNKKLLPSSAGVEELKEELPFLNENRGVVSEDFAPRPTEISDVMPRKPKKQLSDRDSSGSVEQFSAVAEPMRRKETEKRIIPDTNMATERIDLEPQQWLKKINKLWKEGKREEAEESLQAFSRAYPDIELKGYLEENAIQELKPEIAQ
ncbi:MAG: hypothetical protein GKR93_06170 [Gammaproteobacteria bacterium]|nr:hypothetical protein [Gammaproteobacteria bacterium]